MPGVNGHDESAPALQASSSISSLAPATMIKGFSGFIASAGSFCLCCGRGVVGLPALTRASFTDADGDDAKGSDTRPANSAATSIRFMAILPIAVEQPTTISHDDKRHEKTQKAFLVQPGQEDFFEERRRGR